MANRVLSGLQEHIYIYSHNSKSPKKQKYTLLGDRFSKRVTVEDLGDNICPACRKGRLGGGAL